MEGRETDSKGEASARWMMLKSKRVTHGKGNCVFKYLFNYKIHGNLQKALKYTVIVHCYNVIIIRMQVPQDYVVFILSA